jgi:hypothetical protein
MMERSGGCQGGDVETVGRRKEVVRGSDNACRVHMTSYLAKKGNTEYSGLHKGREGLRPTP